MQPRAVLTGTPSCPLREAAQSHPDIHTEKRQTCAEVPGEPLWMVAYKGDSCLAFKIVFLQQQKNRPMKRPKKPQSEETEKA